MIITMLKIEKFEFNMLPVNTYVLYDQNKSAAIIDPGCYTQIEKETLQRFIDSNGLKPERLLNTHLHFDHVFGNPFVEDTYGLQTEANDGDLNWLKGIQKRVRMFGLSYNETPRPIGRVLNDGDIISFGSIELLVLHIPGHSPGSLVFYCKNEGVLFTGDVLFQESIGRSDFPDGNAEALIEGIKNRLFILPDNTKVFPGHGLSTTIGHEKKHNFFLR